MTGKSRKSYNPWRAVKVGHTIKLIPRVEFQLVKIGGNPVPEYSRTGLGEIG